MSFTDPPNIWPQDGLFAFSGVDGETSHAQPFVASGTREGIGWKLWVKPELRLRLVVGNSTLVASAAEEDFCVSDCWRCTTTVGQSVGLVTGAFLHRAAFTVHASFEALPPGLAPELTPDRPGQAEGDITVFEAEGCWVAICADPPAPTRRLGIAISHHSPDEARSAAREAREADLAAATASRLAFFDGLHVPDTVWGDTRRAFYRAVSIMKVNVESAQLDIPCRWTTPDRMPHRHMWLWDSAFHSLGLMFIRRDLAEDAIHALFAKQRPDGKLLLAAQPGRPPQEENDTQPPIVAWAIWRQFRETGRKELIERLYPALVRYLDWFEAHRSRENGLYGWSVRTSDDPIRNARGGESGMDNSPRFDTITAMTAADLSSYMANEYGAMERMARMLAKREDEREWAARRERIASRVNELLWDDEDRFYYDLDERDCYIPVKTPAGLLPLLARIPDGDQAEALRVHLRSTHEFWAPLPVTSVARSEPSFSNDMWRGPTWINMNLLLHYGLDAYGFFEEAREIARRSMREIARWYLKHGCFFEFYDAMAAVSPTKLMRKGGIGAEGGVGFGVVPDLNWTAAAYIHFARILS